MKIKQTDIYLLSDIALHSIDLISFAFNVNRSKDTSSKK